MGVALSLWSPVFSVNIIRLKYTIMSKVFGKVADLLRGKSQQKRPAIKSTLVNVTDVSRVNTEMEDINQITPPERMTTHADFRDEKMETGKSAFTKITLDKERLQDILEKCKETLWQELSILIKFDKDRGFHTSKHIELLATHFQLLKSKYFRFEDVTHQSSI